MAQPLLVYLQKESHVQSKVYKTSSADVSAQIKRKILDSLILKIVFFCQMLTHHACGFQSYLCSKDETALLPILKFYCFCLKTSKKKEREIQNGGLRSCSIT